MKVRFRNPARDTLSEREAFYVSPSQIFLSSSKDYEVHAVSVYDNVSFAMIVDDKDTPIFLPRVLFDVVDKEIPDDWICNMFPTGSIQLVVGPEFLAKDLASYNAMIDHEPFQVQSLWQRIDSHARKEASESEG